MCLQMPPCRFHSSTHCMILQRLQPDQPWFPSFASLISWMDLWKLHFRYRPPSYRIQICFELSSAIKNENPIHYSCWYRSPYFKIYPGARHYRSWGWVRFGKLKPIIAERLPQDNTKRTVWRSAVPFHLTDREELDVLEFTNTHEVAAPQTTRHDASGASKFFGYTHQSNEPISNKLKASGNFDICWANKQPRKASNSGPHFQARNIWYICWRTFV